MEIRLLGPVEVWVAGRPVEVGPPQRCAVLAVLAAEASRPVPVEILIDRVWGEAVPARVRSGLHAHITWLRRVLAKAAAGNEQPPVRLVHHGAAYVLTVDPQRVDLHQFRSLATTAKNYTHNERTELLQQALQLWRGPALATLSGAWPASMRETWALEKLDAAVDWARTELQLGHQEQVISPVRALLNAYPLAEPLAEVLMRALAATGRAAEALDCYTAMRKRLIEQLGTDPGSELQALHQTLLRGDLDHSPPVPVAAAAAPITPAQLPADVRGFAGRADHLARLDAILDTLGDKDAATSVVISAIAGTAGVGKTALAVHWAHRAARRFPDGQLYVNLRGFDPGGTILDPAAAIRGFLDALGVAPKRIPADREAQAALYRTLVADKRILIVLDNARDGAQVRPLLPGAPGCLVLVTSRNRLTSLIATTGAHPMSLDLLTPDEARDLLRHRIGAHRVATDLDAVDTLITGCARLPLALALVAARAATHPELPLGALAAELGDIGTRLDALADDDPVADLRAVFSWSYTALTPAAARLLRLLGLHPGPDISTAAAASLAALAETQVRPLLTELTTTNLIAEHRPGRYTFHDLLRAYATDLAQYTDTTDQRRAATARMLDHYLHTAYAADRLLMPARQPIALASASAGTMPEQPATRQQAFAWFSTEHPVLLAVVQHAAATGMDLHTWQLTWSLTDYFKLHGHWHDHIDVSLAAVVAADRMANPAIQTHAHRILATAYRRIHRDTEARSHLDRALDYARQADDIVGQAAVHTSITSAEERLGNYAVALDHTYQALDLFIRAGDHGGMAHALNGVGWLLAHLGEHQPALTYCQQSLAKYDEIGDRYGQAASWDSLGYIHRHLGNHARAISCYQHAIDQCRDAGDRYNEAISIAGLADTHYANGDPAAARTAWQGALTILHNLSHPDADDIRARIKQLDEPVA
jgi:DNA-binding SARP family transcriptional activator